MPGQLKISHHAWLVCLDLLRKAWQNVFHLFAHFTQHSHTSFHFLFINQAVQNTYTKLLCTTYLLLFLCYSCACCGTMCCCHFCSCCNTHLQHLFVACKQFLVKRETFLFSSPSTQGNHFFLLLLCFTSLNSLSHSLDEFCRA